MIIYKIIKQGHGHTLFELIVVISLIGILSTVAMLNYNSGGVEVNLEAATKKLVSDIYYAQELAMSTGNSVLVNLNDADNNYSLQWADGGYVTNIMGGGDFIVDFDQSDFAGVSIGTSGLVGGNLIFNSFGIPSSGGSEIQNELTIIVLNNINMIKITPYTGRISIDYVSP